MDAHMDRPVGYRYFHIVAMVFVMTLLVSNTIAAKVIIAGPFTLPAGIIVFPLAYIFGDILTEVYGFERSRTIIWWGFFCLAAMAAFYSIAAVLTPAPFWTDDPAFDRLFGFVPRLAASSFAAYLVGEFLNSAILSKIKVATNGKHFWARAVGSTIVGQAADSVVFNFAAFYGVFPLADVAFIAFSGFVLKSAYEVVALPITYPVVNWLKRAEGIDVFDHGVSYTPFKL
jgi:queuosine precursor transporter